MKFTISAYAVCTQKRMTRDVTVQTMQNARQAAYDAINVNYQPCRKELNKMSECEKCIYYRVHYYPSIPDLCNRCGKKAMEWKQNEYGTFYMQCSNCENVVAVDLNTPCESDPEFLKSYKIEIRPQSHLPENKVILQLSEYFQMQNSLIMRKKLESGFNINIEISNFRRYEDTIKYLEKHNILCTAEPIEKSLMEKYPLFCECKYPYSPMRIFLSNG